MKGEDLYRILEFFFFPGALSKLLTSFKGSKVFYLHFLRGFPTFFVEGEVLQQIFIGFRFFLLFEGR